MVERPSTSPEKMNAPQSTVPEKKSRIASTVRKTLQMAGLDMKHVVKAFFYLEDSDQYPGSISTTPSSCRITRPRGRRSAFPQVPGGSTVEITCVAYGDLDEPSAIGSPLGPAVQYRSSSAAIPSTLGKGDQLANGVIHNFDDGPASDAKRRTTLKQAGFDLKFSSATFSSINTKISK